MNNTEVQILVDQCETELQHVKGIIVGLGITSAIVPYLTKYALIKACGTIEVSFKSIIADFCSKRSKKQIKRFLTRRVRENSANPSYSNICALIKDFDEDWHSLFKTLIDANPRKSTLLDHLESLVDGRNEFSHGGNPTISINNIIDYFADAKIVIGILDSVVN